MHDLVGAIPYTCVFIFTDGPRPKLLLVHKTHGPSAVRNRWNGVGGVLEYSETIEEGAIRKTEEETGIVLQEENLTHFCTMKLRQRRPVKGGHLGQERPAIVYFFSSVVPEGTKAYRVNDAHEQNRWFFADRLNDVKVVENLRWLVPLAMDRFMYFGEVTLRE